MAETTSYVTNLKVTVEPWRVWLSWLDHCPVHQKVVALVALVPR